MSKPVVQLEGLSFTYGGSPEPALKGVDLAVQPGEFVAVTGPSGCGKSTLSFCLTGFIPQSFDGVMDGRALIGGHDTRSIAPGELAGVAGLVQQDPEAQLCTLHVAEEVAFGPENLGLLASEIERRLDWALEAAGIVALKRRSLHTLSGGEKQRVAIASVLAMQPQLLILDEPTANLDPKGCREVLAVVERLRRDQNAAIIIFEHRLQHLLPLADRLIVMERGRITADQPLGTGTLAGCRWGWNPQGMDAVNKREEERERRARPPNSTGLPCGKLPDYLEKHGQTVGPETRIRRERPSDQVQPEQGAPSLAVEGLSVSYGQQEALKDISFSLHPGETVALMGDNGCGKSTLLLALLGILKPQEGRICFAGNDLAGCRVTQRAREMGLTFQNPNHQLFEKTVYKEAGLSAQFLGSDDQGSAALVDELLLRFDLERYREKLPFSLSLGEKKRLTLVSVLAYGPPLLLLDEPIVGQDQDRVDLLMEALAEHSRRGGVTLMACHEPRVVAACCSRVLFLEDGGLLIDAPTAAAFAELDRQGWIDYLP